MDGSYIIGLVKKNGTVSHRTYRTLKGATGIYLHHDANDDRLYDYTGQDGEVHIFKEKGAERMFGFSGLVCVLDGGYSYSAYRFGMKPYEDALDLALGLGYEVKESTDTDMCRICILGKKD